jgi:hypothetical protein
MTFAEPRRSAESVEAVRAVLRRALRHLLWLLAALTVIGVLLGWLLAGLPGVWGALMGAGVALVFSGTTVVSHLRTAESSPAVTGAVVMGAWLVKMVLLVALFIAIGDLTFYDRTVMVVVLVVGVLGSLYLDYLAVTSGRVPYVDPTAGRDGTAGPRGEGGSSRR